MYTRKNKNKEILKNTCLRPFEVTIILQTASNCIALKTSIGCYKWLQNKS